METISVDIQVLVNVSWDWGGLLLDRFGWYCSLGNQKVFKNKRVKIEIAINRSLLYDSIMYTYEISIPTSFRDCRMWMWSGSYECICQCRKKRRLFCVFLESKVAVDVRKGRGKSLAN